TLALAVTAAEGQDSRHEMLPPAPCSSCTIRLRRLPLPTRRNRRCCPLVLALRLSYRDVEGAPRRARCRGGPRDGLSVGAALHAAAGRGRPAVPARCR